MTKKGVALTVAIELIAAIVFAIIVLYILLKTGLLDVFKGYFGTFFCTISGYGRGVIIMVVWNIWQIMMIVMTVALLLSGNVLGVGMAAGTVTEYALKSALRSMVGSGMLQVIAGISIVTLMTYMMVGLVFSNIPFICPEMTTSLGTSKTPVSVNKFLDTTSSKTIDCFSMMGGGKFDPLWGLDPPNPKTCFVIEAYLNKKQLNDRFGHEYITAYDIYNYTRYKYNNTWPFGSENELRMELFCNVTPTGLPVRLSLDKWNQCSFANARIFIMYFDKHDYDLISYATSVCKGVPTITENIQTFLDPNKKDGVVICVEPI